MVERVTGRIPRRALGAVAMLLMTVNSAAAQPDEARIRAQLELAAPAGCGSLASLAERVTRRTERIDIVSEADADEARLVRAELTHTGEQTWFATMSITLGDGSVRVRRFRSRSCEDALDALGLVIAITLDPSCASDPVPEPAPTPPPAPVVPVVTATATPEVHPSRTEFSVGLAGRALWGAGPQVLPLFVVQAGMEWDRGSVLSPSLTLGLAHGARDNYAATGGRADFALDATMVDLCPLRLNAGPLAARPCAAFTAGRLAAKGKDTFQPQSQTRPYVTLGGATFLTLQLPWRMAILGHLGAAAPLVRDSFEFSPAVFYRVPALAWTAGLGLGMWIP